MEETLLTSKEVAMEETLLTSREVAIRFGISMGSLKNWRKKGRFNGCFVTLSDGRCIRYFKKKIDEMLIKNLGG